MNKKKFQAWEKVRRSGLANMLDINEVKFIALSKYGQKLSNTDCFKLMLSYDKYKQKYGNKKSK